jgi:tRNA threonylcarbamoyladenosine biosynthesis protein TsaE
MQRTGIRQYRITHHLLCHKPQVVRVEKGAHLTGIRQKKTGIAYLNMHLPAHKAVPLFGGSSCARLVIRDGRFLFFSGTIALMEIRAQTLTDFEAEATRFAHTLVPSLSGATLVTLSGDLGAGKTAFTKVVASVLGVADVVSSPTFVLEKIYQLAPPQVFKRLIHIDAYRLEKGSELAPLGFDELMQNAENLVMLEWPEKVADALPVPAHTIKLTVAPDNSRTISYG